MTPTGEIGERPGCRRFIGVDGTTLCVCGAQYEDHGERAQTAARPSLVPGRCETMLATEIGGAVRCALAPGHEGMHLRPNGRPAHGKRALEVPVDFAERMEAITAPAAPPSAPAPVTPGSLWTTEAPLPGQISIKVDTSITADDVRRSVDAVQGRAAAFAPSAPAPSQGGAAGLRRSIANLEAGLTEEHARRAAAADDCECGHKVSAHYYGTNCVNCKCSEPRPMAPPPKHQTLDTGDCKTYCEGCRWRRARNLSPDWEPAEPTPTASQGAPAARRRLEHLADALADLPSGALATSGLVPASPARAEAPGGLTLAEACDRLQTNDPVWCKNLKDPRGDWFRIHSGHIFLAADLAEWRQTYEFRTAKPQAQPSPAAASTGRAALLVDEAMRNRRFPNGELVRSDMDGVAERVAREAARIVRSVFTDLEVAAPIAEEIARAIERELLGQGPAGTPGKEPR